MGSVYSTRFLQATGASSLSYTVPAGYVAVVRTVTALNTSSSATELYALFAGSPSVAVVRGQLAAMAGTGSIASVAYDLRYVANAGEQLLIGMGADVAMSVSGYLLTLP